MLPSSVRRVVCAAPQTALLAATAGAVVPVFVGGHQRRCSSSKPSRSDSESSAVAAGQSVTASSSSRGGGGGGEKRKRKGKDGSEKGASSFKRLPSVPSTHHISQEALGLSSFFSLHRPISITQTMPRTVSNEHFASIFAPGSRANKVSDTMSTLSSTIDQLDRPMAQLTIGGHEDQDMGQGTNTLELRNPDGSGPSIYLQVDAMSGNFLPFHPPPLPRAESAAADGQGQAEAEAAPEPAATHHRVYKAMFTIEESTEPDGQIRIVAHSPRIVDAQQPRSFLERMARRQLQADAAARRRRDMHAISVKRQRKLRMKKKKYKKLMKRTRNLRRKLDRT
ncbi:hypothetical protein E4U41_002882 [Claviceps citrina]|nr:hypothetical protein E4U41_002882 [Claviceps citrina]